MRRPKPLPRAKSLPARCGTSCREWRPAPRLTERLFAALDADAALDFKRAARPAREDEARRALAVDLDRFGDGRADGRGSFGAKYCVGDLKAGQVDGRQALED